MTRYDDLTRDELIRELEALHAPEARGTSGATASGIEDDDRRFRALFDQSSDFGAVLDRDGTILMLNQAARTALVAGEESAVGFSFWEAPWWADSAEMQARVRAAVERVAAGETVRLDTIDMGPTGDPHTVAGVYSPIRDEHDGVTLILALGRDVTELKRAEATLRESEERYRTLVEHAPEAITVVDADTGTFVDVNQRACELFGLSRDELLACSLADISPPLQPDGRLSARVAAEMVARAGAGETPQFEWTHIDGAGNEIPCEVHLVRLPSATGTLVRGATFDISERKQAERALRQSEERYASLVANLPSVTWATDAEGHTSFISPNVERVYGYGPEEIIAGGPDLWLGRIHPDDIDAVRSAYAALFEGETGTFDIEYRIQREDGEWIWLHDTASAPVEEGGDRRIAYGVFSEITAQKQAEQDLEDAEAQLRQAQKMEAIGRLAGGVAHDFNNLLTIINGHAEFAEEALRDGDPLKDDVQVILAAGRRAAALTRQLLAFSRRQVLEPRVLDLNEVVAGVERMLQRVIGEHIELSTDLAADLGMVMADPGQMEQVMMNLAVNSRDAMPHGGNLDIRTANVDLDAARTARSGTTAAGPHVRLTVADTGSGIAAEDQEHVFEPFFTTKKEGEGTGLGLATVFGIITQSGGDIQVSSEPGQGTTFHVYLPRIQAEKTDPGPEPDADNVQGEETILVVEDDDAVRGLTARVLRSAGYTAIVAANGGDALLECERRGREVELLLTDVKMPKMGGPELAARLSRHQPALKTLYMTGYTDDMTLHDGPIGKGVPIVHKPFKPQDLLTKVRAVLDGTGEIR